MNKIKIGVLASGSGSNLQAIIDACQSDYIAGEVAVVISNRQDAYALERARQQKIDAVYLGRKDFATNKDYAVQLIKELEPREVGIICLAGFLLLLDSLFIVKYKNRLMNIHPSLLPSFGGKGMYGHHVHQAVLDYGCKISGCTIHFVDEEYDHGPIISQRAVPVMDNDTADSLAARILEIEHKIYPEAIMLFATNKLIVKNRKVEIKK